MLRNTFRILKVLDTNIAVYTPSKTKTIIYFIKIYLIWLNNIIQEGDAMDTVKSLQWTDLKNIPGVIRV